MLSNLTTLEGAPRNVGDALLRSRAGERVHQANSQVGELASASQLFSPVWFISLQGGRSPLHHALGVRVAGEGRMDCIAPRHTHSLPRGVARPDPRAR